MHAVPDELQIRSEAIEPTFAHIMGRLFAQAQYQKQSGGFYVDALETLWHAANAVNRLTCCLPEARHASIAASNQVFKLAQYIEGETGVNLIKTPDHLPLRNYARG